MRTITKTKMLLSIFLVAFIAAVVGCNRITSQNPPSDSTGSEQIYSPTEHTFANVADVLVYQIDQQEIEKIHTLFLSLPQETVANVANVLINKNGLCTEQTIVEEYLCRTDVYDNLIPSAPTATDSAYQQQDTAKQTKLRCYEADTVIGGIPYKQIKYQYGE